MSFDWMSFATGFLERTEEIRSERQEEAKTFEREQREAARRNAATISRRRAVADQVTGYANYLRSNGATDVQIQAAIASGPQAIQEFTTAVQAAVERNRGRPLGAEDVAAIIRMPQGFEGVNMSTQEFIEQTYGLAVAPTATEERESFGFLDRLGGRDQMARAEERLSATPFMEGMTIQQINDAAMRGEYESLIPGTFVTFASDTRYTQDDGADFMRDFTDRINFLEEQDEYAGLTTRLGQEMGLQAQQEMRQRQIEPLILRAAANDPEGFMELHEEQLRLSLGADYVDGLKEQLGLTAPEPTEGGDEGSDEGEPTDTTTDMPEVETPEAEMPRSDVATAEDMAASPAAQDIEVSTLPPMEQAPAEGQEEPAPTVTEGEATTDPETGETTVEGTDGVQYTYADWQELTRSQREAAGLPTSLIGAQVRFRRFQAGLGMPTPTESAGSASRADTRPEIEGTGETNAVGSSRRRTNRNASNAERTLLEQGVDAQSIQVLNSRGADIQSYVIEQGATTPLEMARAVEEFAAQEGIPLPEDLSVIIYALQSSMPQQ